jgi:hypothetical protein
MQKRKSTALVEQFAMLSRYSLRGATRVDEAALWSMGWMASTVIIILDEHAPPRPLALGCSCAFGGELRYQVGPPSLSVFVSLAEMSQILEDLCSEGTGGVSSMPSELIDSRTFARMAHEGTA